MDLVKIKAATLRGAEAAAVGFAAGLAKKYLGDEVWTFTHAVDVVRNGWDAAGGLAVLGFLGAFGLTASPVSNISPVKYEKTPAAPVVDDTDDGSSAEGDQVA